MQPGAIHMQQCPCCKGELFRAVIGENGDRGKSASEPPFDERPDGRYFKCRQCGSDIRFIEVPGGPSGVQLALAPEQSCQPQPDRR